MRRREFISGLGCASVALARVAHAQRSGSNAHHRLLRGGRKDREFERSGSLTSVLQRTLKAMGWEEGRNIRIVHRWAEDKASACGCWHTNSSQSAPMSS